MIKEYGIDKYYMDMNLLNILVLKFKNGAEENVIFQNINELASFLGGYEGNKKIAYFLKLVDETADIIEWCNSNTYDVTRLQMRTQKLKNILINFRSEFEEYYFIHVYFKGEDNHYIFKHLSSSCVCLHTEYDCLIDYRQRTDFHILITDDIKLKTLNNFDQIIAYAEVCTYIKNLISEKYYQSYDFNYLKYALNESLKSDVETIIVGCSYPMNGIQTNLLESKSVNLSLPSQDLYYSLKLAQHVLQQNSSISKLILGTGIWSFHFDLSQSVNSEVKRIENVYFPILKDSHHYNYSLKHDSMECSPIKETEFECFLCRLFNMETLNQHVHSRIFSHNQKNYFNENIKREHFSQIGAQNLSRLTTDTKINIGKQRASLHNKLYNYKDTAEENYYLLKNLLEYTTSKDVEVFIINFPNTVYYYNHILEDMRDEYYKLIQKLSNSFEFDFVDLNNGLFEEDDFIDIDHLNEKGAIKLGILLNKFILRADKSKRDYVRA